MAYVACLIAVPSAAYHPGDPQFWSACLKIDWEDNGAREARVTAHAPWGSRCRERIFSHCCPRSPSEDEEAPGAGAWIAAEAKRMKAADEIPPGIGITDFARELERRMRKAAATNKSLRPIKWRSIKNKLPEWGLWPITSIK